MKWSNGLVPGSASGAVGYRRELAGQRDRAIPLVITLGGGYADPIARTAEAHANTFRTAAEVFHPQINTDEHR